MRNRLSFRVAFCGVLAALMIAVMLLGTMIPTTTYICPALAGVLLLPVVWEFGFRTGALPGRSFAKPDSLPQQGGRVVLRPAVWLVSPAPSQASAPAS